VFSSGSFPPVGFYPVKNGSEAFGPSPGGDPGKSRIHKLSALNLLLDEISAGIELQLDLDGEVTSFLPDENFSAKISAVFFALTVLDAQVVVQINPRLNDLAAAATLNGDPEGTIFWGACEEICELGK
jgi:hypothetical protein